MYQVHLGTFLLLHFKVPRDFIFNKIAKFPPPQFSSWFTSWFFFLSEYGHDRSAKLHMPRPADPDVPTAQLRHAPGTALQAVNGGGGLPPREDRRRPRSTQQLPSLSPKRRQSPSPTLRTGRTGGTSGSVLSTYRLQGRQDLSVMRSFVLSLKSNRFRCGNEKWTSRGADAVWSPCKSTLRPSSSHFEFFTVVGCSGSTFRWYLTRPSTTRKTDWKKENNLQTG